DQDHLHGERAVRVLSWRRKGLVLSGPGWRLRAEARNIALGDGPAVYPAGLHRTHRLGLPLTHAIGVADDPRARLELLEQLGPEPHVERVHQVHRDDAGPREIGGEHVSLAELDERLDPSLDGIAA